MSQTLSKASIPACVDSRKAFRGGIDVSGEIAVSTLERFSEYLSDDNGSVSVQLKLFTDADWRRRVDGAVKVAVHVNCQRCLQPLPIVIEEVFCLAVVETEALANRLPPEIDAWVSTEAQLRLHDMVEEQLILGMPIVNRHSGDDCRMYQDGEIVDPRSKGQAAETEKDNPFAVLARLKGK